MKKIYLILCICICLPAMLFSQTGIPNTTPVTQNFDAMGTSTTLPSNWRMDDQTASPTWASGSGTLTQQASSGTPASGGTYNFGSSTSERAVGAMTSGSFSSPNSLMGYFRNTNASNLTQLTVSFEGERYRINTAAASIQFFYSLNGSTWVSVPAGDIPASAFPTGSNAYNFASGTVVVRSGIAITGLNIASGSDIYLRWNINTTGSNSQGIAVDDISVTAAFAAATTYTLTYNGNTNTGGAAPGAGSHAAAATVVLPGNTGSLVKATGGGFTFTGWNTAANGTGTHYNTGANYSMPAAATSLYAEWSYNITYNGNGNTGGAAPGTQTGIYSSNTTISGAGTLTRSGFIFNGWNTAANGSGTAYAAASAYPGATGGNVTLYAQWKPAIVISEYMYNGLSAGGTGEFVEFTNISNAAVDMTGWSFDDASRTSGSESLGAFGLVQPGESVIFTDLAAATFRTVWNLCAAVKIIGGNGNDLSRTDEINLYNASGVLVDRLTYDDATTGGPPTQEISAWVPSSAAGNNTHVNWVLSAVNDSEISYTSTTGEIGSPGISTLGDAAFVACPPLVPEINLQGNGNNIATGSTAINTTINTDFGNVIVATGTSTRTYTIQNTGTAALTISGISFTGANSGDFTLSPVPSFPLNITAGGSTTFTVSFDPSALGARNAVVNIANNDADENPYTFAIRGNGINNSSSDIINDASYAYTSNIDYLNFQGNPVTSTGNGIGVMRLTIRDGGVAAADTDGLGTELTSITFNVANIANIRSAALFGGATQVTMISNAPVINYGTGTITFTGLSGANVTAANNAANNITLRISFLTAVTDNQQLQFTVAAATSAATGSAFGAANAGGAISSTTGDRNRIEVTADRLRFIQQPTNTSQGVNMTPAVTVAAVDVNFNTDLDFVSGPVNVTSTGTLNTSPQTATPAAGLATFATINHTAPGTGLQLTAQYTGLTSATSSLFNITTFIFQNGDYQPSADYTNFSVNGAWEVYNAGVWTGGQTAPQNLSTASRPARIIINRPGIGGAGNATNTYKTIIVADGGELLLPNNASPTVDFISSGNKLEVQSGGSVVMSGQIEMNANASLVVKNGGSFTIGNVSIGNNHVFWDGIENFEPGSVFNITDHANTGAGTSSLINLYNQISDNASGAKFGDLNIDFNPSSNNWTIVGGPLSLVLCDNLTIANNSNNTITMFSNVGSPSVTIRGNVTHTAGIFSLSGNFTGSTTAQTTNIDGNLTSTGGTLKTYFNNSGSATASNININLKGNLAVSGTTFLADGTNVPKLNFTGNTLQTLSVASNCISINLVVKSGASVQLQNQNLNYSVTSLFTVENGGTFDFGFNGSTALRIFGSNTSNNFTSALGAYLKISSPLGLNTVSGQGGNVDGTITRNINTEETFHYTGKAPSQVTGNALTTSSNGKTVIVELDALSTTLTLTNGTGITSPGRLEIIEGTLISAAANPITSTGTLIMSGGAYQIGQLATTLPQLSGAYTLSGNSTIELNGAGNQVLRGARAYRNLTFSNSGTKTLTSAPSSVTGTITVANTASLNVSNNTMGGAATNLTMTGTARYITAGTDVKPDAGGVYLLSPGTTIEFTNTEASLQKPRLTNPIPAYANIEVSGTNVGTDAPGTGANSFLQFGPSGNFTVTGTGTFKIANIYGFSGAANTAIGNANNPTVNLLAGSTIEYNGSSPDHQLISNQTIALPTAANYVNLKLSGTANKTAPASVLALAGNLEKTGTGNFLHNDGTVLFNGGVLQSYSSEAPTMDFYNFTNSNNAGLAINNNLSIARELLLGSTAAKLNLNTGNITLKSDAVSTANVAEIPSGAAISYTSGKFIVERYVRYTRRWQFLSVPANTDQTIFNSWQEGGVYTPGYGVKITGIAGGTGLDMPVSNSASMKYQTTAGGTTFTGITNTTDPVNGRLSNIKGYMLFVYGDRSSGAGTPAGPSTILRTTGRLFVGNVSAGADQPVTTSVTAPINSLVAVGNPFASPISFVALKAANSTIANTFVVWDPSNQGNYGSGINQYFSGLLSGLPTPGGGGIYTSTTTDYRYIQSGQAFYVQSASAGTVTVPFTEAMKGNGYNLATRDGMDTPQRMGYADLSMISSFVHQAADGRLLDGNRVVLDDQYAMDVTPDDAIKLMNDGANLGIKKDNYIIAVEARPTLQENDTIRYFMNNMFAGNYQFRIAAQNINRPLLQAELIDQFTNSRTPVSLTDSSFINFTLTNDVASRANDRFYIVFKTTAVLPVNFVRISAARQADRSIKVNWQVSNEINIIRYEVERSADGTNFTGILQTDATNSNRYAQTDISPLAADNFYRIKAIGIAGYISYSSIVKVAPDKGKAIIVVTPNPVKNGVMLVRFEKQPSGKYLLQFSNNIGQTVFSNTILVTSDEQLSRISLPSLLAKGTYQLSIRNEKGKMLHTEMLLVE